MSTSDPRDPSDDAGRQAPRGGRADRPGGAFRDAFSLHGGTRAEAQGDPLEDFDDDGSGSDLDPVPVTWPPVLAALLGIVLALILAIWSYTALQRAEVLGGWANDTWSVSGTYTDMTHDLEADGFNPKYALTLPDAAEIADRPFDDGLKDPYTPEPGQATEVRGEGIGSVSGDFEKDVDVLLGVEDGELRVLATEPAGEIGPGITDQTVSGQRTKAIALGIGAAATLAAGIGSAVWLRRRARG